MEPNILNLEGNKKQSLEAWVIEVTMPIVEMIGVIVVQLEMLYQELE